MTSGCMILIRSGSMLVHAANISLKGSSLVSRCFPKVRLLPFGHRTRAASSSSKLNSLQNEIKNNSFVPVDEEGRNDFKTQLKPISKSTKKTKSKAKSKASVAVEITEPTNLEESESWDRGGRTDDNSLTPLQEAIRKIVNENSDCVSLVQVGSFYELYFHQAEEYGPKLGIKVALRTTKNFQVPMAGFPVYQLEKYVKILVHDLGENVAIVDQIDAGNGSTAEGAISGMPLLRRVSRIVSPGTLIDESFMNFNQNNYLLSISLPPQISGAAGGIGDSKYIELDPELEVGLAWCDVSLGEFNVQQTTLRELMSDITRINPSEIILPKSLQKNPYLKEHSWLKDLNRFFVRFQKEYTETMLSLAETHFDMNRKSLVRSLDNLTKKQIAASHMILSYIATNLPESKPVFDFPREHWSNKVLKMDPRTREALELNTRVVASNSTASTLFSTIRRTMTDSGTRMLRQWINAPILEKNELVRRQDFVESFESNVILRLKLREKLSAMDDFVRSIQRLSLNVGDTPTHLKSIASGLQTAEEIVDLMHVEVQPKYQHLLEDVLKTKIPSQLAKRILNTFEVDEIEPETEHFQDDENLNEENEVVVQLSSKDIKGVVSSKYDESIEKYRLTKKVKRSSPSSSAPTIPTTFQFSVKKTFNKELKDAHDEYSKLLLKERTIFSQIVSKIEATGSKIKIVEKAIHGKHLDVIQLKASESSLSNVISLFDSDQIKEQRQTSLVIKPDEWHTVKEKIERVLFKIFKHEERIIQQLRREALDEIVDVREIGRQIDFLDVTSSFAVLALECNLVRPKFAKENKLDINEGRHIVVEDGLKQSGELFIPNDTNINSSSSRLWVITGPNMGGKSTYLRQNALIVILAQIGSYVPARSCKLGLVDRIFTRIGASDDISRDLSTFMVEMVETSNILENATEKSLAIVDELGRGTSGKEGLSIAYGALVSLLTVNKCRTMFATHYGVELQQLLNEDNMDQSKVKYYKTGVKGGEGKFILDHKLRPGISKRSYALEVAEMAGFPKHALQISSRAWEMLNK
ncbi:DNA mismatch repair protein Msh1p, mitochondrial [[Candida] railenensis]|uniref:DNA mismatch repair protein Msh1p, mitochondrial n=1 Tax=[Candida] railenensis TaxID=45579 RepID=A0A9P0W0B4_9ASCO|nr:DNA mismatch repair protein Msh1p, mitochondrial [[Candida] railenensis]